MKCAFNCQKLAIALSSICKREAVHLVKNSTIYNDGHHVISFIPRTQKLNVIDRDIVKMENECAGY